MKQELLRTGILTAWLTAALTGAALAMPSGGTLTQGNVTVDQGSLAAMSSGATIKATEDSVIEWTDFDLAAADELHFDTINGAIINRVPAGKAALLVERSSRRARIRCPSSVRGVSAWTERRLTGRTWRSMRQR